MVNDLQTQSAAQQTSAPQLLLTQTNWTASIVTCLLSFVILTSLNGALVLSAAVMGLASFVSVYAYAMMISLVIGMVAAFILKKAAGSDRGFFIAASLVSFSAATILSIFLAIQETVASRLAEAGETAGPAGLFRNAPDALLTGLAVIISFNVPFLIRFLRKEQRSPKDLMAYVYGSAAYVLFYFVVPSILA